MVNIVLNSKKNLELKLLNKEELSKNSFESILENPYGDEHTNIFNNIGDLAKTLKVDNRIKINLNVQGVNYTASSIANAFEFLESNLQLPPELCMNEHKLTTRVSKEIMPYNEFTKANITFTVVSMLKSNPVIFLNLLKHGAPLTYYFYSPKKNKNFYSYNFKYYVAVLNRIARECLLHGIASPEFVNFNYNHYLNEYNKNSDSEHISDIFHDQRHDSSKQVYLHTGDINNNIDKILPESLSEKYLYGTDKPIASQLSCVIENTPLPTIQVNGSESEKPIIEELDMFEKIDNDTILEIELESFLEVFNNNFMKHYKNGLKSPLDIKYVDGETYYVDINGSRVVIK